MIPVQSKVRLLERGTRTVVFLLMALLLAAGACNGNSAPTISSLIADPDTVPPEGTSTLTCFASDRDGDTLTYQWTEDGWIISSGGSILTWTAPDDEGTYTIGVTVSDGNGGAVTDECHVVVAAPTPVPTPEPTPTPTPTATPTPLPTVSMTCTQAETAIQAAIDAYHSAYGQYPTADGGPGDIVWTTPNFIDAVPGNDSTCNWGVNSNPPGQVCAKYC